LTARRTGRAGAKAGHSDPVVLYGRAIAQRIKAGLLSRFPDSHIERKYGYQYSGMVAARMALLSEALDKADSPEQTLPLLYRIDQEFKSKGINPGTTADLTVATILTVLLEDVISHYNPT